jgi:SAM-dependent methyltransferase
MSAKVAFRDLVRSSVLGPVIRDVLIRPYQRMNRLQEAKKLSARGGASFVCNICGYRGPFANYTLGDGSKLVRLSAFCADCGSAERHRLQKRVLDEVMPGIDAGVKSILHFAPETYFETYFRGVFGSYKTADLFRRDADVKADISALPLTDASYDVVYASHVLEHVPDDRAAVRELYRILKPGGVAILPVPIYSLGPTIEYGEARPEEDGHVRGPGLADYFDRYREVFDEVRIYSSSDFPVTGDDNQLFVIPEPTPGATPEPLDDYVPVCRKRPA